MQKDSSKDPIFSNPSTKKTPSNVPLTQEEQHKIANDLRKQSRMRYLTTRAEQQLDLLNRRLKDEEKLFNGISLTEEEKKNNLLQQKIYEFARKKINNEYLNEERYNLPDDELDERKLGTSVKDKKIKVLYDRYKEKVKEEKEEDVWEREQKKKAGIKYGAMGVKKESEKYELVIENQIDFVKSELMEGMKQKLNESGESSSDNDNEDTENQTENANLSFHNHAFKRQKLSELKTPYEMEIAKIQYERTLLPIYKYKTEILSCIRDNKIILLVGETGSGKTTQLPQYLNEVGYCQNNKKIVITQPRRVAAMSVASRVAYEMNTKLGHEVGYSIRFEDYTSNLTRIKYMTDGIFLRELLASPDLSSYSVIIIDEAHERTIYTDVIFGLIKDLCKLRDDIKVIISSATLSSEKFSEYFDGAPIIKIPGKRYPVDIYYTKQPEADYIEASVVTALQIHLTQDITGDILIFLTGQEEIETAREMIYQRTKGLKGKIPKFVVLVIYAALPSEEQAKIFAPRGAPDERKIILATNIAETSITIDGIVYVIDCGFSKQMSFNPRTGLETLAITPISKAAAKQRAGRAGRVRPGKCFRLYTAWSYQHELDSENIPEIQRSNLTSVILLLKSLGIDDLLHFDFIDPPPNEILIRALEQLYALGALNNEGDLTKLGRKMAEFPVDPCLGKAIIASTEYKCLDQMLTIASMLSIGGSIFYRSKENQAQCDKNKQNFYRYGGDHFTLLSIFEEWKESDYTTTFCRDNFIHAKSMRKARDIREQLVSLCEKVEIDVEDEKLSVNDENTSMNIRKAIASGYFYNAAHLNKDGVYRTIKNPHVVNMHPSSSLFKENPRWVIYHELVFTNKEYMREVIEVEPEWLKEVAGHYYKNIMIEDDKKKNKARNKGTSKINY